MKKLILIIALFTLSCTVETEDTCNCQIEIVEIIEVTENGVTFFCYKLSHEETDVTDCNMDGVIIKDNGTITKTYICN